MFRKDYRRVFLPIPGMKQYHSKNINQPFLGIWTPYNEITLITFHNVLCRTDNTFYFNNTIILLDNHCQNNYKNYTKGRNKTIEIKYNTYERVIMIGHQYSDNFGHWIIEILPCFLVIPRDIIDTSYIALPELRQFIVDTLDIFNFSKKNFIVGKNTFFYAKKMTTVFAAKCLNFPAPLVLKYRALMVKKLDLDKKEPFRYVFMNRLKGFRRYINNWDDIITATQLKYPNVTIERGIFYENIYDQFKYFNEIKVFVAMHGAVFSNIAFMQESTITVEIEVHTRIPYFRQLGLMTGKKHITIREPQIPIYDVVENYINVSNVMLAVDEAMLESFNNNRFTLIEYDD